MYEVQQTRWDRLIRRVSGSIGPGSRVSETLSELFPMLDVERVPGELLLLGGTRLGWGGAFVTGTVGNINKIQLFNPADSGTLVTITRVDVRVGVTSVVRYTNESSARPTAVASERFRDSRLGILPQPVAEVRSEASVPAVPAIGILQCLSNINISLRDDNALSILGPGSGFVLGTVNNNTSFAVSFWWRERAAEPSELQF